MRMGVGNLIDFFREPQQHLSHQCRSQLRQCQYPALCQPPLQSSGQRGDGVQ